jgi:hypothetical protein
MIYGIKYYWLETYLFDEVGPRFAKTGNLDAADFYMIVIWKANRAKRRIRNRLNGHTGGFKTAVKKIGKALAGSRDPMRRLEILMTDWEFRLPMATAILTVLYPTEFSVYDMRVCEQLNEFNELSGRKFSPQLWEGYQRFLEKVKLAGPPELSLRDKDRYLWGCSFYEGVLSDLRNVR